MIIEEELKEIEKRCELTTPGPWVSYIEGRDMESGSSFIMTGIVRGEDIWNKKRGEDIYISNSLFSANQDFIAHAKQDIPMLIEEIRKLRIELAMYQKC